MPRYLNWYAKMEIDEEHLDLLSNILRWFRYIDNIFMLWTGSNEALHHFMLMLDTNNYNLKFTMESNENRIAYLDVTLSIEDDGTISTSLYRKPTAGNTILHTTSAHTHSLVQSIPFSQYLLLRRNCSSEVL